MAGFAEFSDENYQPNSSASLQFGIDANPDQAADSIRLARRYRLPVEMVESDPAEFKRHAKLEDSKAAIASSPKLKGWLAFSDANAKIAHDDLSTLSEIEKQAKLYGELKAPVGPESSLSSIFTGIAKAFPQGMEGMRQGVRRQFADLFGLDGMGQDAMRKSMANETDIQLSTPKFSSLTGEGLYSGGVSLIQQAPGMAASILTGNPAFALGMAGVQSETTSYSKYRNRGGSAGESFLGAMGDGATEVGTEMLPMGFLVNKLGKVGAGDFLKGFLGRELAGEETATLIQDAIDTAIANPDKTWGQYIEERPGAAYQTALATLVQSGVMTGAGSVMRHLDARSQQADRAPQMADLLGQMNKMAEASKLVERDPETALAYFQSLLDDGADSVYITPEALAKSGMAEVIARAIPEVADQLEHAAQVDTDIRLPIAELLAKVAGPEFEQSILPHVSDTPGGFTPTTAQEYFQSGYSKELQDLIDRTVSEGQIGQERQASADMVKDNIRLQLDDTGRFTPEVRDAYSSLVGNWYGVTAQKMGMTAEQLFVQRPLKIGASDVGGQQFNQPRYTRDQLLALFKDADTINIDSVDAKDGISDDEIRFLSNVPAGTRFTHSTRLLDRVRRSSEAISNELGGSAETRRVVLRPLGSFTGYGTQAEVIPGDEFYNQGGALKIKVYGNEQVQAGLLDEPALTFTVMPDGELSVNGPTPGSKTFEAFKKHGWAEQANAGDKVADGWSALTSPLGGNLPMSEVLPLLADVHARVREWRQEDKVGLYWARATGSSAALGDYGAAVYFQNNAKNRGSFNPETNLITLLKDADLSTFLHESAHFFLEAQMDLAQQIRSDGEIHGVDTLSDGEQQMLTDADTLFQWWGIKGFNEWYNLLFEEKRTYHEKFARGFESYLYSGESPNVEMQGLFQRFREFILSSYRKLIELAKGDISKVLDVKITPEVKQVFDRMLATDEQIKLAQQARSMFPLFESAMAGGMTEQEFSNYQRLGQEQTATAIQELQAKGLRDMQWLGKARSRELKKLQKEAKEKRAEMSMEARRLVMSEPVYQAWSFLTRKMTTDDKLENPEPPKSDPNSVDESIDSLFVAIAKLGGINKQEAVEQWGIDPADKPASGVFGKHVWRSGDQGMSLDGMAEALSQYSYLNPDENGKVDLSDFERMFADELRGNPAYSSNVDPSALRPMQPGDQVANLDGLNAGRFALEGLEDISLPAEIINHIKALKMTAKHGLHPDIVADLYGLTSGDELVRTIAASPTPKEAIESMTDQLMLGNYGELATPEALEKAADQAVHNEARARMVATELQALERATGERKTLISAAKAFAAQAIARLKIRNIKPGQFASAEVRSGKAAQKSMKSGDTEQAAVEKRNQLVASYETRAAYDALDEVDKGVRYFRKFDKAVKGIDPEYLSQIQTLLERFDLRNMSIKAMDRRGNLKQWIESMQSAGFEPDIPENLIDETNRKPYKEMTVEEFRSLVDSVKQIEHLGRLKKKLLTAKDQRDYAAVRDEIVASIHHNAGDREANTRTPTTNIGRKLNGLKRFWTSHIKVATWANVMDGGKDGPVWEYFLRSGNERGDMETTMRAEATKMLHEILGPVFKQGKMGGKGQFFPAIHRSLNREERLAIALNVGNEGNLQRLLGGEGWTLGQIMPVLQSLTPEEKQAVQAIWDYFESYRPEIGAKEKRVYGKEPAWVIPGSMATTMLGLRGGYYPIKYDPAASQRAEEHTDAESAKRQMQGAYTTATTRRSFTKSRVEEIVGRPLLYSLSGVYSGVNDVIHDLAWHEWLIDANRLLKSHTIDEAMRTRYGPEVKRQFKTWVQDIAEGDQASDRELDVALSWLRQGVSAAGLSFNIISALKQPLGITQSFVRVGYPEMSKAIMRYIGHPIEMTKEANEKSSFMMNRSRTRFRELNELRNKVQDETKGRELLGRYGYFMMMRCQQMVDVPTWWGAYNKSIAQGNDEDRAISLADQSVIDAQGGGQTKDLSGIERGGPAQKLFTVFYSFMNTALNNGVRIAMTEKNKAKMAVDYLMLYTAPVVLGHFLVSALVPGDSGDDDENVGSKLLAEQIDYVFGLMVVIREFSEAAKTVSGANDKGRDYQGPAGVRMVADAIKFGKQASQGEFDDAFRKAFVNLAGDMMALPSAQINRTITGINAVAEGETDGVYETVAAPIFGFQKPH